VHEGSVVFFTQATSPKARDVARDPRVALSVTDRQNPYRSAWLRGRVARVIEGEEALTIIDLISHAYIGRPFPMRSGNVFVIEPEAQGSADLPFKDR
jgi:hypothetical protein